MKEKEYKVLLISPSLKLHGGVVEFNKMLLKYGRSNYIIFELKSVVHKNILLKTIFLIIDFSKFCWLLITNKIDLVHVNPSLGKNSIKRDGVFIIISKFFKKKVFVHWHGWNPANEYLLEVKNLGFIKKSFFKADHIKFLSVHFENKFKSLGFKNKTSLGSTFVDDALVNETSKKTFKTNAINLLFLSTVSKNKGIYIVVSIFKELYKKYPNISLIIAGKGEELDNVRQLVASQGLNNVYFTGFVSGKEKNLIYSKSHIYLFPSMYEGMPTSLLEALCFGLPIVCSNVGAIPEFFEEENMGYMIENINNSNSYVEKIMTLLDDNILINKISNYNSKIGFKKYLASKNVLKIEQDYKNLFR
jgi:glycosyltransferase involved in cell wall biosynthesis